jgi:hypothetical protein
MMSIFTARLEACDPARDRFRSYRLEAGPDLFGIWLVDATYGRIGSPGHTIRYVADDEASHTPCPPHRAPVSSAPRHRS